MEYFLRFYIFKDSSVRACRSDRRIDCRLHGCPPVVTAQVTPGETRRCQTAIINDDEIATLSQTYLARWLKVKLNRILTSFQWILTINKDTSAALIGKYKFVDCIACTTSFSKYAIVQLNAGSLLYLIQLHYTKPAMNRKYF